MKTRKNKKPPSLTLQSTAYHEAGHHAMKRHLGLSMGKVTIKPDHENDTLGSSAYRHQIFKREIIEAFLELVRPTPGQVKRIENHIMVCLAGREAELIFRPGKRGLAGARDDYEQVHIMLHILVHEFSPQFPVYWKLLLLRTRDILALPGVWCAVEGLAQALLERETLSGKESRKVIMAAFERRMKAKRT